MSDLPGPGDYASPDELDCEDEREFRCLQCGWANAVDDEDPTREGDSCPRCKGTLTPASNVVGYAVRLANELNDTSEDVLFLERKLADARRDQVARRESLRSWLDQAEAARKLAWRDTLRSEREAFSV